MGQDFQAGAHLVRPAFDRGAGHPATESHQRALATAVAVVAQGAAPFPLVELNTTVPTRGPIVLHGSGAFPLLVYCGPLMRTTLQPSLGGRLDTYA